MGLERPLGLTEDNDEKEKPVESFGDKIKKYARTAILAGAIASSASVAEAQTKSGDVGLKNKLEAVHVDFDNLTERSQWMIELVNNASSKVEDIKDATEARDFLKDVVCKTFVDRYMGDKFSKVDIKVTLDDYHVLVQGIIELSEITRKLEKEFDLKLKQNPTGNYPEIVLLNDYLDTSLAEVEQRRGEIIFGDRK